MEFLYRNATPIYVGNNAQPPVRSGLFASLFGTGAPAYKTVDGGGAYAQPSSGSWWQAFSTTFSTTPSYQTAPPTAEQSAQSCDAESADNGGSGAEARCVCAPDDAMQIVILE